MKKVFLLVLAGAITLSSFASDKGKSKGSKKSKKAIKTEQVCPATCPKGSCGKM